MNAVAASPAIAIAFASTDAPPAGGRRAERRLIHSLRNGRPDAVEELFRLYWSEAQRASFLIIRDGPGAEDVAQEALLAAVRAIDSFDRRRPLRPWLHKIIVNRSLDWLRARERRRETELGGALEEAVAPDEASGRIEDQLSEPLLVALERLSADERVAIVLRHLLGYSPKEIAGMLDVPAGTVRARISRGLAILRTELEGGGPDG